MSLSPTCTRYTLPKDFFIDLGKLQQNLQAAIEKKREHEQQLAAERALEARLRREQRLADIKKKEEAAAAAAALERQHGPAQVPTQASYMEEVRVVQ